MKNKISLVWLILSALGFIFVAVLLFTELTTIKEVMISEVPESQALSSLNKIFLLAFVGAVAVVITLILAFGAALRKTVDISTIVNPTTEEHAKATADDLEEEGRTLHEEQIIRRVQKIDSLTVGDSLKELGDKYLIALSKEFDIVQAIFYSEVGNNEYKLSSSYAYYSEEESVRSFKYGHGLPGQVAMNKTFLNLNNIPKKYLTIMSGLGKGSPRHLFLFPIIVNDRTFGVVELASFTQFDAQNEEIIRRTAELLSAKIILQQQIVS